MVYFAKALLQNLPVKKILRSCKKKKNEFGQALFTKKMQLNSSQAQQPFHFGILISTLVKQSQFLVLEPPYQI